MLRNDFNSCNQKLAIMNQEVSSQLDHTTTEYACYAITILTSLSFRPVMKRLQKNSCIHNFFNFWLNAFPCWSEWWRRQSRPTSAAAAAWQTGAERADWADSKTEGRRALEPGDIAFATEISLKIRSCWCGDVFLNLFNIKHFHWIIL